MRTALDSNILSALWSNESSGLRIETELTSARAMGSIVICGPVYVEVVAHPLVSLSFVEEFLAATDIEIDFFLDEPILRRAAVGFSAYAQRHRQSGGIAPKRMLPDFLIAAHALLRADRLMTLDPARYQQDFTELRLV
ncbi:MAG: type II toxin-antitoxin system VapC family toxin [Candidatus Sulfotelmatobacter sp.]